MVGDFLLEDMASLGDALVHLLLMHKSGCTSVSSKSRIPSSLVLLMCTCQHHLCRAFK